jgi:hypothetical protein
MRVWGLHNYFKALKVITLCLNLLGHPFLNHSVVDPVCSNFWASWIRIRESEVQIRIGIRLLILLSSSKNSKNNLDSYCLVTFL